MEKIIVKVLCNQINNAIYTDNIIIKSHMSFIQATLRHHVSCNNGSEQPSEGANCVCCDATVANWEQKKIFDVENASHTDHRRAAGLKHVLVYVSWSFKKISCENNTALLRTRKLSANVRYCLHFEFTSNWV